MTIIALLNEKWNKALEHDSHDSHDIYVIHGFTAFTGLRYCLFLDTAVNYSSSHATALSAPDNA
jgi:hypothetical protein